MKKLVIGSVMMVSIFAVGAMAEELTGFIGDSNCGAKHEAAAAKDVACAKGCIKKGADAVLLSNGKVYKFDADSAAKAKEHAGEKVTVNGSVSDDVITATSIEAAK